METHASHTAVLPGYDGTPLFVRRWPPEREAPRATVLLVHGYAEHSGRYEALAARLTARGFALAAYDQRGFGRSGGPPALVRSFDEYVADLHAVVRHVRSSEHRAHPLFLMGHSMGGAVVLLYVLDHGARPAGLILSSPLVHLPTPRLLWPVARLAGRLAPALPTVYLERDAISRDPSVVAEVLNDPLCYTGRIKARTGAELLRATRRLRDEGHRLGRPFLLVHGTADRITAPSGSRALYARARSDDKTLALYNGFYHETFNDPGGERVLIGMADWLDERSE